MREVINPNMELKKEGATSEPIVTEKESAKMPQVGTMPTGKKAAKKAVIGMG